MAWRENAKEAYRSQAFPGKECLNIKWDVQQDLRCIDRTSDRFHLGTSLLPNT
jgi:hypothetical protein